MMFSLGQSQVPSCPNVHTAQKPTKNVYPFSHNQGSVEHHLLNEIRNDHIGDIRIFHEKP